MDGDTDVRAPCSDVTVGDSRPLVGRGSLTSRQVPVELEARGSSPVAAPPGDLEGGGANPSDHGDHTGNEPPRLTRRNLRAGRFMGNSLTQQYYGNSVEVGGNPMSFSTPEDVRKQRMKQSRRLPYWVWLLLAKSLGIKMHDFDRPICGTIMHVLTLLFAFGFAVTHAWYKVYDIVSNDTKETVLRGTVSIAMVLFWCSLGIYANKLAGRLFVTPHFLDSIRLHSKTIFKISAAGITIVLGLAAIILNCFEAKDIFDGSMCRKIVLNIAVCKVLFVTRVICSIFTLIWNLLVAIILLSVCRTHTIGIRRFIHELEEDGRTYEKHRRNMMMQGPMLPCKRTEHDDDNSSDDTALWEDDFDRIEGPYNSTQASPCLSPSNRNDSLPTSQASAVTGNTLLGPDWEPVLQPQVFNSTNAQYFPSVSPLPAINASYCPNTLTVEADVVPPMHNSATSGENSKLKQVEQSPHYEGEMQAEFPGQPDVPMHSEITTPPGDQSGNLPSNTDKVTVKSSRPIIIIREGSVVADEGQDPENVIDSQANQNLISADPPSFASRSTRSGLDSPPQSTRVELSSPRRVPSSMTGGTEISPSVENASLGPHLLTPDEILLSYWKINCRLRTTSLVMQRWLCAVVSFILLWCFTFIFYWMKHETSIQGIIEFIIPIFILPIITSAYGEVNFEGRRMLKCICPTQGRIKMLYYLINAPLELTAFGFAVNYGLMVTALGAVGLAFVTKLIIQEVGI